MKVYCKDCYPGGPLQVPKRPRPIVPDSGGRCATHWRQEKARRRAAAHEARVQREYGLGPGEYGLLYRSQGGVCAICGRAKGTGRRKLSVDHDHRNGRVRGLLCSPCNVLLGHIRDDPATARRIAEYLAWPPTTSLGILAVHKDFRKESDDEQPTAE